MPDGELDDPDSFYQQLDSSEPNTARLTNPLNKRLAPMVEYERASCAVMHSVAESTPARADRMIPLTNEDQSSRLHMQRRPRALTLHRLPEAVNIHGRCSMSSI